MTPRSIKGRGHAAGRAGARIACLAAVLAAACAGCAMTGASAAVQDKWAMPEGQGPAGSVHATSAGSAARELAAAKRMIKAGEYSLVIPRLQQMVSKYPGDPAAIESRYYLGEAYYNVGAYTDSLHYLNEYISLAPDGDYADNSRALVARLTGTAAQAPPSEQEAKVSALEAAIAAAPEDIAPRLELAELLWSLGRYDDAGRVYAGLLEKWPRLESDVVVRRRVERDASGNLVVLSPVEAERRYREAEPLKVYNVSSFKSGRFEGWPTTATERYYNVTGQAVNQGETPLNNVQIAITLYGLGQMVYDTKTVSLGAMRPGEVRAFSAQFTGFDEIYNIVRQECVGTFQR